MCVRVRVCVCARMRAWDVYLITRMCKRAVTSQGFIQGGTGGVSTPPPLRISGGISPPPPLFLLIQKEACHQGIINSWLCYSLLGDALSDFSNA